MLLLCGDARFVGRWRSDRERTMADWRFPPDTPEGNRAFISEMFGKLELRYTRWRWESTFDGHTETYWYQVLAKDGDSAMIRSWSRLPYVGRITTLVHVHFEETSYWITLGSSNQREFFTRI
jgi:hypothetical protein